MLFSEIPATEIITLGAWPAKLLHSSNNQIPSHYVAVYILPVIPVTLLHYTQPRMQISHCLQVGYLVSSL